MNQSFAEYNWIIIDSTQYLYGTYLLAQIKLGSLAAEDITKSAKPPSTTE